MNFKTFKKGVVLGVVVLAICALSVPAAFGQAQPTLDPLSIPKYVTPLVIPPVMPPSTTQPGSPTANYNIAVREFPQQILPTTGCAPPATCTGAAFQPTTVWSYGLAQDDPPAVAPASGSTFNYPAFTIETSAQPSTGGTDITVRWINDLVDGSGNFLSHLLPVDQTLHWANPPGPIDHTTIIPVTYEGPVPIVTHVHGAHVDPDSDGYPEAWWLPAANDIDCIDAAGYPATSSIADDFFCHGSIYDEAVTNNNVAGSAYYSYRNDQPATTLWYHDHSLGMTRLNVYAGPAGFWLIRGGENDWVNDTSIGTEPPVLPSDWDGVLPGPAPLPGEDVVTVNFPSPTGEREKYREIPIVIQDRSFNNNGSLFYPDSRAFFDLFGGPYIPTTDIAPIWNPEAFFNVMVVNGVSWPRLEVAPALYRFRLLNGCNSRFLNLALFRKHPKKDQLTKELSFFQIGAEQGFLPNVVEIRTSFATPLPGDGTIPADRLRSTKGMALLMGLAERADVIVDFRGLKNGDIVRMINTAPDAPFGGFPDVPADPATTGQVMEFVVKTALLNFPGSTDATATDPYWLMLNAEGTLPTADNAGNPRNVSLNEEESATVCWDGVSVVPGATPDLANPGTCRIAGVPQDPALVFPVAPKAALLGTVLCVDAAGNTTANTPPCPPGELAAGNPLKWTDAGTTKSFTRTIGGLPVSVNVTENPTEGDVEEWDIYNFTVDAHPIHLHLVRFEVIGRSLIGAPVLPTVGIQAWETGYKDTVIAYPGEITRVKALFDIPGLYVWHCHIVEHEDNEMMRPYYVDPAPPA